MCVCVRERERERKREIGRQTDRRRGGGREQEVKMLSMTSAVRSAVQASFVRIERLSSVSYSVALYYVLP